MQNFDPALETRIIKTLLDAKAGVLLSTLNKDWFGLGPTKEIWARIETLRVNGKAIPSSETLSSDPVLSEKAQMLLKGDARPFTPLEIDQALDHLDRYRKGRVILRMLNDVTEICKGNEADLSKAQTEIQKCLKVLEIPQHELEVLSYGGDNDKTLELYDEVMSKTLADTYIQTGFDIIDSQQGGLGRGRVYTIGAPSGGGKSTLANNIGINVYQKANKSVGYFSFEMNKEECLLRTQASISRIPLDSFNLKSLTNAERKRSDKLLGQFLLHGETNGCRLDYHCPTKDITIVELFAQAEHMNYDVIVVDYINLMAPLNPKDKLWENIGESFRLAKRFAERTQKVVIMLVQIDEETGNIKYAKSIKHHSDGVWVWEYGPEQKESNVVTVEQMKLRNGKPIKFELQTEFEFCTFTEIPAGVSTTFTPPAPPPRSMGL